MPALRDEFAHCRKQQRCRNATIDANRLISSGPCKSSSMDFSPHDLKGASRLRKTSSINSSIADTRPAGVPLFSRM
ncbi:hypothetical protein NKI38_01920 [Mesorhizobium sp. M0621]|uniref:hypothetical protein n=1 Tax=Mesorhizobium sp. M0621 TaxID=2956974 RepID=UPI00333DF6C8